MKKFTKVSLIIAVILGGVGILFCGVSALLGGWGTVDQMAGNGELNYGNWHIGLHGIYYHNGDDYADVGDDGTTGYTYTFAADEIQSMELNVNAAAVDFKVGTDAENVVINVYRIHEKYYDNEVRNGTLIIEYDTENHYRTNNYARVAVEIPEGMQFDTVELNVGATEAKIEGLSCQELTLYVGAGELTTTGFTVTEKMTVSLGAGTLDIGGGTYGDVSLDCGIGELSMAGTVNGNLTADCGVGEMEIELFEKSESDYNYMISCGLGEVEVNGRSYSNISGSYEAVNAGAVGTIELDCGMGSIEVEIGR